MKRLLFSILIFFNITLIAQESYINNLNSIPEHPRILINSNKILQIKEKYGELRWYDENTTNEIQDIIAKYSYISRYTCIDCRKPAHYLSVGWICPYCQEHAPNNSQERKDFYGWIK